MHFLSQVAHFISQNWGGPDGFWVRSVNQIELTAAVVAAAALVGIGVGVVLGHTGRGGFVAVNSANAARAIPSLALLTLLAIQPAIGLKGNGFLASFLALFALAVPPILTNAYVGVRNVDADVRSAARAMGMTAPQVLGRVELPLALPLVMAGLRTAAVEVVATATLAAYVSYADLGSFIFAGLNTQNHVQTFAGGFMVAVLALLTDLVLAAAQRAVTPVGLRRGGQAARTRGVGADATTTRRRLRAPASAAGPG